MPSPAVVTVVRLADLTMETDGESGALMFTVLEPAVTTGPVGGVPSAVEVSTTEPWSMSSCVTV